MAARRHSSASRFLIALAIALVTTAAELLVADVMGLLDVFEQLSGKSSHMLAASSASEAKVDEQPLEISTIVDELEKPDRESDAEKKREEEKKKEEDDKHPHGQVVDVAKPLVEERPDQANYVSEYDTKVDHEMKLHGRDHGGMKDGATPLPPSLPEGVPQARPTVAQQPSKPGRPGPLAMRELQRATTPRGAPNELAPAQDGDHQRSGQAGAPAMPHTPRVAPGDGGSGRTRAPSSEAPTGVPGEHRPELVPTPEMLSRAIGKGGGTMDYLKDVDDGDGTALNSKKWNFASFFNRVKRQVADEWHPELVYVQHDPNGNVYGVKDRVTVLRVHLSPDGKLASWNIMQSSGVDFLDDEAIGAFKKAQPFPNPPKALIDPDGQIHFNFAFIFELSGRNSLKVYKYN